MISKDGTLAEFHQRYTLALKAYFQDKSAEMPTQLGQFAQGSGMSVVDLVHLHQITGTQLGSEAPVTEYNEFLRLVLSAYERSPSDSVGVSPSDSPGVSQPAAVISPQFNCLPDILYAINLQHQIQHWNLGLEKVTGLTATNLIDQSVLSLFPPEEHQILTHHINRAFIEGQSEIDTKLLTRTGLIPYHIKGMVMKDPSGTLVGQVTIGHSLTQQTLNFEALRDSEERFRHLVENLKEVFWLMAADHRYTIYVSPSYEKVWGRSCQSLYQNPQSWLSAIHPQECDRLQATLPAQRHGPWEQEYRIIHPSGIIRWIRTRCFPVYHPSGPVYRLAAISEDITEHKQTEAALERSIALLQATLESTAEGILVLSSEGEILNFNSQYLQLWNIPSSLLSSRDARLVMAFLLDRVRYPEDFLNIINQDYQDPHQVHKHLIEIKGDRILELVSRPYKLRHKTRGRVHCFRDVTAQIKAAETLESINEELEFNVKQRTAQLHHLNQKLEILRPSDL